MGELRGLLSLLRFSPIVLILLLGAYSRGLHISERSIWIDEGYSFYFAQSPDLAGTLASDVHPPLYFAALRLWGELAGHSELALRWFSLLPSMCSLAFIFQLAREARRARSAAWGGYALPVLAMLMLALADVENYLSQEIRHYTWLSLLALASMLFLLRWLRMARRLDGGAWLLASTMMLYTHYIAAFALVAQGLYLVIWMGGKRRLRALIVPCASVCAMTPWLLTIGMRQLENRGAHRQWSLELSGELLREIGVKYFSGQWALMLGLLALGCVTLIYRRDSSVALRFDRVTPLLLLWLTVPFCLTVIVNEFLPFLLPHRLIQWTPAIALLVACGLSNIRQPIRALMIAVIVVYGVAQLEFSRVQPDWRRIAWLTARYAAPGDLILSDVSSGDYALRYYLLRDEGGARALDAGIGFESLQLRRRLHADDYEAWLPRLLDGRETVWLMYWSSDESAFNWLDALNFKRTARYAHRHDGGDHGETLMHVYRFDRASDGAPAARFANGMILRSAEFDLEDLRLDALWETARPLERDYSLSAKLLDAAGRVVAQADSQPQANQRPTSGWREGELIYSPQEMQAAHPLAPGRYRVIAQAYTREGDGFRNAPTIENAEYAVLAEIEIGADD